MGNLSWIFLIFLVQLACSESLLGVQCLKGQEYVLHIFCSAERKAPGPFNVYWFLLNICKQVETICTREVKKSLPRKRKKCHGIMINVWEFYFTVKMKINTTELRNFSISESKFKSQIKQLRHCTAKICPQNEVASRSLQQAFLHCKRKSIEQKHSSCYLLPDFFRYYF